MKLHWYDHLIYRLFCWRWISIFRKRPDLVDLFKKSLETFQSNPDRIITVYPKKFKVGDLVTSKRNILFMDDTEHKVGTPVKILPREESYYNANAEDYELYMAPR